MATPSYLALQHAANTRNHALGFVVGVSNNDFQAAIHCLVLKIFSSSGKNGLVMSEIDQPHHATSPRNQCARMTIGEKVHVMDHLTNSFRRLRTHLVRAVNSPRYRGRRYLGSLGNLLDIHERKKAGEDLLWRQQARPLARLG